MIVVGGDVFLGKEIHFDESVLDIFNKASHLVVNFENVLENSELKERDDKYAILTFSKYHFEQFLTNLNTNVILGLANNHINDLGSNGISSTQEFLDLFSNKCSFFGAGNMQEVLKPHVISDNDKRIAFVAGSTDNPESINMP